MAEFGAFADRLGHLCASRTTALVLLHTVDSTHTLAQRILADHSHEAIDLPAIDLIAWQQLAGRGRQERRWSSPPGQGAYVTLLRELPAEETPQGLPLAVAVALCRSLRHLTGSTCLLKWPNDLVVGGRKIGGILIDTKISSAHSRALISFGINWGAARSFDEANATSLIDELDAAESPGELPILADLVFELIQAVEAAVETPNDPEWVSAYRHLSKHRPGDRMCCRLPSEEIEGTFMGFDERGFLRLKVAGNERSLSVGEVLGG